MYLRNDAKSRTLERAAGGKGISSRGWADDGRIQRPAQFLVDIERGQKTGWFAISERIDWSRHGRAGAEVLEVFAHTGGLGFMRTSREQLVEGLDVSEGPGTCATMRC